MTTTFLQQCIDRVQDSRRAEFVCTDGSNCCGRPSTCGCVGIWLNYKPAEVSNVLINLLNLFAIVSLASMAFSLLCPAPLVVLLRRMRIVSKAKLREHFAGDGGTASYTRASGLESDSSDEESELVSVPNAEARASGGPGVAH